MGCNRIFSACWSSCRCFLASVAAIVVAAGLEDLLLFVNVVLFVVEGLFASPRLDRICLAQSRDHVYQRVESLNMESA